jgi:hypothetical protein
MELIRYNEPLNTEELTFLERKEEKERTLYFKVYKILMLVSFIVPFITAWYRATDGAPNAFSAGKFFVSAGILLFISTFSVYMAYRTHLHKVQLDLRDRTKTIEINHIVRKLQMTARNAYYFYIDSKVKISIEVSYEDFANMNEGDEVSIEYTTHSRLYLGYF